MAKIWKYVAIAAVTLLLLGAICIGVGFLTGAVPLRITAKFIQYFHVQELIEQFKSLLAQAAIF